MRKIVVIESGYIRDSQIYTGDPNDEDITFSEEWTDVNGPNLYLGIGEGSSEEDIKNKFAASLGVYPEIISLYDIS